MNNPYSFVTIGLLSIIAYILSLAASKLSVIKTTIHRKFWNTLLLITFFTTAILGLIMVFQVNLKLHIPFIDEILVWHVNFGIAMAMIAIFHFSWHIKYYIDILKKGKNQKSRQEVPMFQESTGEFNLPQPELNIRFILPVIALGFSALVTQVILLREFLSIFNGNELVIGIILTNWMILTGIGSFLGKISPKIGHQKRFTFYSLLLLGILPLFTVFFLNFLKNIVFDTGSLVSVIQIFYSSFILLIPFCLLSGFLFTYLSFVFSEKRKANLISHIYSLEALGSILGGLIFSFFLVFFLKTMKILTILLTINLFIAVISSWPFKKRLSKVWILFISVFILSFLYLYDFDAFTKKSLYKDQYLIYLKDTPYGNLAITKTGDQLNFYENNILMFSTLNTVSNEEAVHYALVQHSHPKNILLVSGGISGITNEILKYDVDQIDYVELNPWILKIGKNYTEALDNQKIRIFNKDARIFIRNTTNLYDVAIIALPEPGTAQLNRFYTLEFFKELKEKLTGDAVVSLSLPSTENYISKEAGLVNSIIYNTLKEVFTNVIVIPGERNFYLVSDNELSTEIARLIEEKGINNIYVNQYYLDDQLLDERSNYILSNLDGNTKINKDFKPVAYFRQIAYWLSYFSFNYWIFAILVFLVAVTVISRLNPVSLGMFAGGFAASSIEIILIISFQILYGYVYLMTGIIFTVFMAGLALGAFTSTKVFPDTKIKHYMLLQTGIGIFAVVLPFIIIGFRSADLGSVPIHLGFFLLTIIISGMVGMLFSLASKLQPGNISGIAAEIYGTDLIGSAFGALLVSAILIPIIGLIKVAIIVGGVNLICALITLLRRKQYVV